MTIAEAPFPFTSMFQNGPRRQGSAPQNLFKPGKDFPPPRTNRAPLPAPGRSEDLPQRRERGQMQSQYHSPFVADYVLPLVGIVEAKSLLTRPQNPKIRAPPVDDVNNLRHDCKCQRRFASTAIQIRRNALFTSPEYAIMGHTAAYQTRSLSFCNTALFVSRKRTRCGQGFANGLIETAASVLVGQ
jgi:hypothetical protein